MAIRLGDSAPVRDAAHVDELFDAARVRANEGLVVKDPESIYTPGRRGKSWLKYKKALATLDCVVTYAQWGNGKRRAVLSDLTFAVRKDGELVNIGKAYSGLTDVEIAAMTEHFKATTIEKHGPVHRVQPTVVLEIAFDRIQESSRHKSGYAMRFPRIARIRDDKTVDQISTIDEVRRIYRRTTAPRGAETRRLKPMPLYRSRRNSMIAGVCGGLAEWLGWSPTWVRLLYIVISILSVAFPGIIVYIILWVVMPKSPV